MQYKDLPPYEKIFKMYHDLYPKENKNSLVFLHNNDNFFPFYGIDRAYDYLKNNRDFEVSDKFFRNNFPFLRGYHNDDSTSIKTMTLVLKIEIFPNTSDGFENSYDFKMILGKGINDLMEFLEDAYQQGFYVSRMGSYFFKTVTYEELLERFMCVKVMSI